VSGSTSPREFGHEYAKARHDWLRFLTAIAFYREGLEAGPEGER
jgi:hypothetical protein